MGEATSTLAVIEEGDNRPAAYKEGDLIVLRASSFGSACIRDLVLHLLGEHDPLPTPPDLQVRFDAGHAAEPHILNRLHVLGWRPVEGAAQKEGELHVLPGVVIRFHPDGVMTAPMFANTDDFTRLVECKALAPSSYAQARTKGTGSLFSYDWQLSVMMHALKLPATWVALCKNMENPDDYQGELHLEHVTTPPKSMGQIVMRARKIVRAYEEAREGGELPECEDPSIYPCPFLMLRPEKEKDEGVRLEGDEADLVDKLGKAYIAARDQEKAAKEAKERARGELLDLAGGRDIVRGRAVRFKKSTVTRTWADADALKADGLWDKYKKSSVSERVDVEEVG